MNIDRRDFIKYGVLGVGASALLDPGVAVSETGLPREEDFNYSGFMKPSGKETSIADHPLSWWVNRFQLPLHVYFAPVIVRNVRAFKQVFQNLYPKGHIRFAAKACAHPAVFKMVIKEGAGIDVASYYETQCALESGAPPEHLDLNGNCKEDSLCLGFHTHIGSQIADLEPYLAVLGKLIELGHLLKGTGGSCEIINIGGGFPISYVSREEWDRFMERTREGYLAAQKGDQSRIFIWNNRTGGYETGRDGSLDISHWNDEKFYSAYPKEKMVEAILKGRVKVNGKELNTVDALKALGGPALVIEPGRSVVGDSAVTLAKVSQVRKIGKWHNLVTLEMGVTGFGEALVYMPVQHWEIINDYGRKDPEPFETFVGGNLCFSGDMLARYKISLQRKPVRGDIVLIHDTGSYGPQFFASNANSFPRSARVLVGSDGKLTVMRRRDTYKEIYSL